MHSDNGSLQGVDAVAVIRGYENIIVGDDAVFVVDGGGIGNPGEREFFQRFRCLIARVQTFARIANNRHSNSHSRNHWKNDKDRRHRWLDLLGRGG